MPPLDDVLPDVPSAIDRGARRRALDRLGDGWRPDLLVIGAGFTGCGIALDAATRGLSVALVDAHDLAHGTSRWSSKLVHGGLRYLAKGDLALAHESAVERGILMERTAPHLTRALRFLTPVNDGMPAVTAGLAGVGYVAGNVLRVGAGTSPVTLPGPRWVGPGPAARMVPGVGRSGLRGGWVNTDGQLVDDARMVVALARTAHAFGAEVITRMRASDVQADRCTLTDTSAGHRTGETVEVRAGRVVVAAGAWSDQLDDRVTLRPSKGVHLVIPGAALGNPTAALSAPVPGHLSRFVFLLPQLDGRVFLGLTDDPVDHAIDDEPVVFDAERDMLLDAVNRVLEVALTPADVIGGYAGYRPLVVSSAAGGAAGRRGGAAGAGGGAVTATADLSRAHLVLDEPGAPITIVGGKLTTYRRMAADVVDRLTTVPCTTAAQPIVGAMPRARLVVRPEPRWLVRRYGAEAADLVRLIDADPWLGRPVVEGLGYLRAELAWAALREGAQTAADLVDRRTRIGLVPADRAPALDVAGQVLERLGVA